MHNLDTMEIWLHLYQYALLLQRSETWFGYSAGWRALVRCG
jgi:hypothetical protein